MMTRGPARLIAIGGLSGSGKSWLARALAARIGADHLSSDVIRKELAGIPPTARLPRASYTPEAAVLTYAELYRRAESALAAGRRVVVDAVHARAEERRAIAALAARRDAVFLGVWLELGLEDRAARIAARIDDPSDVNIDVARQQEGYETGPIEWNALKSNQSLDALLDLVLRLSNDRFD